MTDDVVYLELDDLIAAARASLGHQPEIRDAGLLESALARPRTSVLGADAYPTIHEKAAALVSSLVTHHALVDGNKRLGLVAVRLFYALNDYRFVASDDAKFDLIISLADGRLRDIPDVAYELGQFASLGR